MILGADWYRLVIAPIHLLVLPFSILRGSEGTTASARAVLLRLTPDAFPPLAEEYYIYTRERRCTSRCTRCFCIIKYNNARINKRDDLFNEGIIFPWVQLYTWIWAIIFRDILHEYVEFFFILDSTKESGKIIRTKFESKESSIAYTEGQLEETRGISSERQKT